MSFDDLMHKVANQGQQWGMLEHFKVYFARAAGSTASTSSSESWAASDLHNYMMQAAENAPLFIAAFYDACVAAQEDDPEISIPDVSVINRLLAKHSVRIRVAAAPSIVARSSTDNTSSGTGSIAR